MRTMRGWVLVAMLAGVMCGCDSGGEDESAGEGEGTGGEEAGPARTLAEIAQAAEPGVGIPEASPYEPGPGTHKFIYAGFLSETTAILDGRGGNTPDGWAETAGEIELIVWVKKTTNTRETGMNCTNSADGESIPLIGEEYEVVILEARTGAVLESTTVWSDLCSTRAASGATSMIASLSHDYVLDAASAWIHQ